MYISELTRKINHKLADETRTQSELIMHMDSVIDDINTRLNSKFPTYSEVIRAHIKLAADEGEVIPESFVGELNIEYNYIPDKYQRSVVIVGAAVKFYETDEEGNQSAVMFANDYQQNLFFMQRDFSFSIPEAFQEDGQGFLGLGDQQTRAPNMRVNNNPFDPDTGSGW